MTLVEAWLEGTRLPLSVRLHDRVPASLSGLSGSEFGQIAFVFETVCSADCELYFMMVGACLLMTVFSRL